MSESGATALAGRRVLITGASRGIGAVVAAELASEGASLVLVARDATALENVAGALPGQGHETVALDVRDEAAWNDAADRIGGPLHGLVTAAALLSPIGKAGTWSVADFRATLDVNVTGTLLAFLACRDGLLQTHGSVVTLSGGGATAPLPRFDAYAASKAAVVRLTENLARDFADDGVRLNAIAPGFIVTPMHNETIAAGPDAVGRAYFERTKRALDEGGGDPPELAARLCAFLLSDAAAGITGKLLSARWDPWEDEGFRQRLRDEADLATLRRIDEQFFVAVEGR